jgi:hypothetical protein
MLRRLVEPRTPFAAAPPLRTGDAAPQRPGAAHARSALARAVLAPFAAALLALAGLVYVLLLPICGIASVASAVAQASWAVLREGSGGVRKRTAPRS